MQIGMVGLGRMGANMARPLPGGRHALVAAFEPDADPVEALEDGGYVLDAASSLRGAVDRLAPFMRALAPGWDATPPAPGRDCEAPPAGPGAGR